MKIFRISLIVIFVIAFMVAVSTMIFVRYGSRKSLPDYNENQYISTLGDTVRVFRDSTGIPHIYAANDPDLYRVVGYLSAQDRLWQMDILRRLTQGRLSEIFGKEMLSTDKLFRALQFRSKSEMMLDGCSQEVLNALKAYSEGVNQYLEDNAGKLPPEFSILGYKPEKWKPVHSASLVGYMSWSLTIAWSTEVKLLKLRQVLDDELFNELIPDLKLQDTYVIPGNEKIAYETIERINEVNQKISELGLQVFTASNNWAVSGSKTLSGNPILANDMHLELRLPGIWYQMHQSVPGSINVSGLVLPGSPFIICGHNENVAWGMTNMMVDDIDFYQETINPEDSTRYRFNGEWKKLSYINDTIFTREKDTILITNAFTHRGPVISGFKRLSEEVVSMRWIGNQYSNEIRSVYLFNRMKNWEEFRNAAKTFIAISQNIAYADVEGNIGMQTAGGIPIRGEESIFIAPGDTNLYDWEGIVDFEELPFTLNPENGFVASANNRVTGDDYPYYISNWYGLPNRIERIVDMLEKEDNMGVEYMKEMQSDVKSPWAEKLVPFFLQELKPHMEEAEEQMQVAFSLLDTWDYEMTSNSVEASIFEQLYFEFLNQLFRDEMGDSLFSEYIKQDLLASYVVDRLRMGYPSEWYDNVNTPEKKEDAGDIIILALQNTINKLSSRLGENMENWQWGKLHTLLLEHPLGSVGILDRAYDFNRGPYPVGGSYHTVSPYFYSMNDLYRAKAGASHRHIYPVGDWDRSLIIIPAGISGIPASNYYDNQIEKYLNFEYNLELFSSRLVKSARKYEMLFIPGEGVKEEGGGMF